MFCTLSSAAAAESSAHTQASPAEAVVVLQEKEDK
jgi:hypothetical protein